VAFLGDVVLGRRLDPADPDSNIRMSACYLRWLLDRTGGDLPRALAAYYQGLRSVEGGEVLPESAAYAGAVLAISERYF
jgi:hypothetical protein